MEETNKKKLIVSRPYDEAKIVEHEARVGGKRNLREVVIQTEDGYEYHYLVKKPSKSIVQAIAEKEQKKEITGIQKLLLGCVLEGDQEAYEHDGAIYATLLEKIGSLVEGTKSDIKKL